MMESEKDDENENQWISYNFDSNLQKRSLILKWSNHKPDTYFGYLIAELCNSLKTFN